MGDDDQQPKPRAAKNKKKTKRRRRDMDSESESESESEISDPSLHFDWTMAPLVADVINNKRKFSVVTSSIDSTGSPESFRNSRRISNVITCFTEDEISEQIWKLKSNQVNISHHDHIHMMHYIFQRALLTLENLMA